MREAGGQVLARRISPLPVLVGGATLVVTVAAVYAGGVKLFASIVILAWLLAAAYRWPLVIAALAVLQSFNFFQFVSPDALATLRLGPGLTLSFLDLLVFVSLPFAIARLAAARTKPLFLWPILALLCAAAVSMGAGLLSGDTSLDGSIALGRNLFYYSMYFVIVAAIDTRPKLDTWATFLMMVMAAAGCLHIIEVLSGTHLPSVLGGAYEPGSSPGLTTTGGYSFLYLWNRAPLVSFLALLLVLGVIFETRPVRLRYLVLAGLGTVSVLMAFVRQWFVYLGIGIVGTLMAQRTGRTRGVLLAVVIAVFVAFTMALASPLFSASFGSSPVDAWLARASSILTFEDEKNHQSRMDTMTAQWDSFLGSPFIGHGETADFIPGATSSDVGVTNVLVALGVLGLACVVYLWGRALLTAFRLRRRRIDHLAAGYLAGLIGFLVAAMAGFLYGVDYFTGRQGVWVIVLALALLDRIRALAREEEVDVAADENPRSRPARENVLR